MSEWFTIIVLILAGIGLVITEIILIPGTTLFGILGFVMYGIGLYLGFDYFGEPMGWYILSGAILLLGLSLYFSFRSGAWKLFALKDTIDSKVNEGLTNELTIGDQGKAMSALRPMGKADFDGKEFEVKSLGNYVETGALVEIIKIDANTIFVKEIKLN